MSTPNADGIGTDALIDSLWKRGDLGLAWLTFEKRRRSVGDACDDLEALGVPPDVLEPIRALVRKPISTRPKPAAPPLDPSNHSG